MLRRWTLYVGSVLLGLCLVGGLLGAFVLALLYPTLPSLESLTDYHPKIPLGSSRPRARSWANSARSGGRSSPSATFPT
jgi:hypothetical protein